MRNIILKLHIYAGLLTFSQIALYGVAGLVATVQLAAERPKIAHAVQHVPFRVSPGSTDKQVADEVFKTLQLPLTRPMPSWFLRRTPQNDLLLDFYNINGIWRVIVLEREGQLRIEQIRNSLGLFLGDIHATTTGDDEAPRLLRAWGYYNEFAMWCLLAFCASGVYLWLTAQARTWWAWASVASGTAVFALLWMSFR
jgi:uncharacterized iron-regulated membrane protein